MKNGRSEVLLGMDDMDSERVDHPTCWRCLGLIDVDGVQPPYETRCFHQSAPPPESPEEMRERLDWVLGGQ